MPRIGLIPDDWMRPEDLVPTNPQEEARLVVLEHPSFPHFGVEVLDRTDLLQNLPAQAVPAWVEMALFPLLTDLLDNQEYAATVGVSPYLEGRPSPYNDVQHARRVLGRLRAVGVLETDGDLDRTRSSPAIEGILDMLCALAAWAPWVPLHQNTFEAAQPLEKAMDRLLRVSGYTKASYMLFLRAFRLGLVTHHQMHLWWPGAPTYLKDLFLRGFGWSYPGDPLDFNRFRWVPARARTWLTAPALVLPSTSE